MSGSARTPDYITLKQHRDRAGTAERWVRWVVVAAIVGFLAAGLADVFGQRPSTSTAGAPAATLRVEAPSSVRGGLLFQGRVDVRALRPIEKPTLVLAPGWFDGITVNTVQPEPSFTVSETGGVAFHYPRLETGRTLTVYYEFQVNPTTVGRRTQDIALRDGPRPLVAVDRSVTIFP